jgi:pantothenate kinase type III
MTGGLGKLIASGSRYATDVDENLTLTGLRLIYERHSERQRRHR